ncbi:MAG: hypothetical protein M0019_09755 [Actinomycetota bacterium]|nr:hypothetical protein [Actinomycetota bacterium]
MDPVNCLLNFLVNKLAVRVGARMKNLFGEAFPAAKLPLAFSDARDFVDLDRHNDLPFVEVTSSGPTSSKWFEC